MRNACREFPTDPNAAAFYALSLLTLAPPGDRDIPDRQDAIAVLDPLFRAYPNHPGAAHYLIHAADAAELASQGLEAARQYARIAPDSSHALHMPSHIFVRLGLWQESIDSNLAAAAAAAKDSEIHHTEYHYQTHAMDFLDYSYLQSGQEAKARALVEELKDVPGLKHMEEDSADQRSIFEARNALELHRWKEAASLPIPAIKTLWLDTTYWARAIGAARSGDAEGARNDTQKLAEIVAEREADERNHGYTVPSGKAIDLREAEAWLAYAEGKFDDALETMRGAAERQERSDSESLSIPPREMLADMLLELNKPADALAEYKAVLKRAPNRFDSLFGAASAAESAGNAREAQEFYARLVAVSAPKADRPELRQARTLIAQ
jgi:tetratricopeptide (TPR) repeat protein